MNTTESPELLTLPEVAVYLRIGMRTAYKLVTSGAIPAVKVGGQWRIPRAALEVKLGRHSGVAPEKREPGSGRAEGSRGGNDGQSSP